MSRTENSLRNIKFTLVFRLLRTVVTFFTRKVFVMVLTQDYLGLDGIFSNILSMFSLTELGIGSAISYSLYKPLAENDREQTAALMRLFGRAYRLIGIAVALLGCALAPFLSKLIRDIPEISHIYVIYILFVLNSALSYLSGYKQSLLIADQRQYLTAACNNALTVICHLAQALLLWITRNYFVYLAVQIGMTLLENVILSFWTHRLYPYIATTPSSPLKGSARKEIMRNTKAMLAHKVGGIVVLGTDQLLISYFIGAAAVGIYSNYFMVTSSLNGLYALLFSSVTASIGNLGVTSDCGRVLSVFRKINFAAGWLYGFTAISLGVLLNPFIELWVGADYLFEQKIVWLMVLNFYLYGMRQAVLTFRDAMGLYWYERHKPIVEMTVNMVVSVVLAVPFGVAGIFIGTIISTISTCFWVEPLVLHKYGLHSSVWPYYKEYLVNSLITLLTFSVVWQVCVALPGQGVLLFLAKLAVCVAGGNTGYLLFYCRREEFHYFVKMFVFLLNRMLGNRWIK